MIQGTRVARDKWVEEEEATKQEVAISQISMKFTFFIEKYKHHLLDIISLPKYIIK